MQAVNEELDRTNGALATLLIRTILESRRALRMAWSMLQELTQTGTVMDRLHESQPPTEHPKAHVGTPNVQVRTGAATFALKRRSTPRTPLRLVSPFRHDSPLVMPGTARFADDDEPVDETDRNRGRSDTQEGKEADPR